MTGKTIHDNARILADQLASSLKYEYFSTEATAEIVAEAMSMATGSCWVVVKGAGPVSWWVQRQGR